MRKLPRDFKLHWGKGVIAEEASAQTPFHEPCIQLLQFEDGSRSLRFCTYNHQGRFQRVPLIVSEEAIEALRESVQANPGIRELIEKLAAP